MNIDLQTAANWLNGRLVGDGAIKFTSVGLDTRALAAGSLFIGIKGANFDGNKFVPEALKRGAVAAITSDEQSLHGGAGIVVGDTLRALGDLAFNYRWQRHLIPWFAVTGSNGKSTTRRLVSQILRGHGKVCEPTANYNNFIGMPLTILQNTADTKFGVLEMGTSAPGEIRRLTEIANPTIAAITNVAPAHLQGLQTVENVAREKREIFSFLADDGLAIFPADSQYTDLFRQNIRRGVERISFALDAPADVTANVVSVSPEWSEFTALGQKFSLPLLGRHNVNNALIAIITARRLGFSLSEAADALAQFTPIEGRLQMTQLDHYTLIDDAYNANPESIKAAARTLAEFPAPRRVLILGDMCELGAQSAALHRETGSFLTHLNINVIIAVGTEMLALAEAVSAQSSWQSVNYFPSPQSFLKELKYHLHEGDAVLVKGSHSMNLKRVVNAIKAL